MTIYNSGFGPSDLSSITPKIALTPRKVLTFEIYVDPQIGTQSIEVYDRKDISNAVETFALKFEIRDQKKINKLKKFVKQ